MPFLWNGKQGESRAEWRQASRQNNKLMNKGWNYDYDDNIKGTENAEFLCRVLCHF